MFVQLGKLGARRVAQRRGFTAGTRQGVCASCGAALPTALPVCRRCRHIGRVDDSVTHHELLGLAYGPNPFVVDAGELKRRFLEAQRVCHPDGWATGSEAEQDAAQAVSNAVNTAYRTLKSPLERVGYLLERNGAEVGETDSASDPALMAEVMATREAVEEGGAAELARLRAANTGKMAGTVGAIEAAVGRAEWAAARAEAVRLKYLVGIAQAIERRTENAE